MDVPPTPQVRVPGDSETSQPAHLTPTPAVATNVNANATVTQNSAEVEMGGMQDASTQPATDQEDIPLPDVQEEPVPSPKKTFNFVESLISPIVEIVVGKGDDETVLRAHQNFLTDAPFLAEFIGQFEESGPRQINLPEENVDAFGCFLQFQYTRDYDLAKSEARVISEADKTGKDMLRHARIYTLAEKLGLPNLKNLAHGKIHKIKASPGAELAYARYVYTHTPAEDVAIRRPVASLWANQSHILRHEVGDAFKKLCIEVPQFSFDVMTIMLDRKEKSSAADEIKGSARKRSRREI